MLKRKLSYMTLPKELDFMLSLCLGKVTAIPSDLDWEYFSLLVKKNRIEPLVASEIVKLPASLWRDNPVLADLSLAGNKYAWISINQMKELGHVMSLFQSADIRAISVKGPILAMQLYGNPALRYSKDLDILVDPMYIMEARDLLLADGWEHIDAVNTPKRCKAWLKDNEHISFSKGDVLIELHDKMEKWGTSDFDTVWETHKERMLMGISVPYLSDENNVYLQIVHACGHGFFRLRWLLDLYRLFKMGEIDFTSLYASMEDDGEGVFLLETLLLMDRSKLLALPVIEAAVFNLSADADCVRLCFTEDCASNFKKARYYERMCEDLMVSTCPVMDDSETLQTYLKALPKKAEYGGMSGLIRRMTNVFTPCTIEWESLELPDSKYYLYYPYRIYYWIKRRFGR